MEGPLVTEPTTTSAVLSYKDEALQVLKEWQAEVATDRGVNATEANAAELYQINNVINMLEAI